MATERPLCGVCESCLDLTRAILRRPPTMQDKVVALVRAGRTTQAIANELGITAAAVASHKSRARRADAL